MRAVIKRHAQFTEVVRALASGEPLTDESRDLLEQYAEPPEGIATEDRLAIHDWGLVADVIDQDHYTHQGAARALLGLLSAEGVERAEQGVPQ
jgi:hypothetical protein